MSDLKLEAELWQLDKRMTKRGQDIGTWSRFDVYQFASAYAYYKLYMYLHNSANDLPGLLKLVRLANLTKAELQKMYPAEKKSLSRIKLYQKARKEMLNANNL